MRFLGNKCIEVWSIEDVEFAAHSIDEPVSKQEAKTVLMYMARYFDSSNGVNWAYIEEMIRLVKRDGGQPDKQLMKNRDSVPVLYHDFCDDEDKMRDFPNMTKQDFLAFYDYLTEEEYDMTVETEAATKVTVPAPSRKPSGGIQFQYRIPYANLPYISASRFTQFQTLFHQWRVLYGNSIIHRQLLPAGIPA